MALEMAGEVCLVMEADLGRDPGRCFACQEPFAGLFDASADDIGVRGDPVALFEAAYEMRDGSVEQSGGVGECDGGGDVPVQEGSKPIGEGRFRLRDGGSLAFQVLTEPFSDHRQPGFDVELLGREEVVVQAADRGAKFIVVEGGCVNRRAHEIDGKKSAVKVEVPFVELPEAFRRVAVVGDAGRKDGDRVADRTVVAGV